jgi:hypothetical protein
VPNKQDQGAAQQQSPPTPAAQRGGDHGRPAPQTNYNGLTFARTISNIFSFCVSVLFDPAGSSMTSGSDRMAQAREINGNLPSEVQSAFNADAITYYDLGTGNFCYKKLCSNDGCFTAQITASYNCYMNRVNQQLHYLTFENNATLEESALNSNPHLPPVTKHSTEAGETLIGKPSNMALILRCFLPQTTRSRTQM